MYRIGLDIGTTSICGVLFDTDSGRLVKSITHRGGAPVKPDVPYARLIDVNRALEITQAVLRELLEFGRADSIGVTGQMHGIVYIDANGKPVSPVFSWQDGRGNLPYKDGLTYAEYFSQATGTGASTGYGAVTHFYNTVNGLVPEGAVCFATVADLAVMSLTGKNRPLLHPTNAASIGAYDLEGKQFLLDRIEALGVDASFFPRITHRGKVTFVGEAKTGIPVAAAIGDNQAALFDAVGMSADVLSVNVGTGSQVSCIACDDAASKFAEKKLKITGGDVELRPYFGGRNIAVGAALCGGRAYALLADMFRETVERIAGFEPSPEMVYDAMDKAVRSHRETLKLLRSPTGDAKLPAITGLTPAPVVNTTFSGTRANPHKRGSIENIGTDNFTMGTLAAGFSEGIASELYSLYGEVKPFAASGHRELVGAGNGLRLNPTLCESISEKFGLELSMPESREEAALGAALLAEHEDL
ncbi:MAG: hypothetical protein II739_09055 [Clostridia bacterium]|nr:hypothetical protein [Clostridia bacterium]